MHPVTSPVLPLVGLHQVLAQTRLGSEKSRALSPPFSSS